ncbi:MAG: 50S ribosomal protein L32 [Bacteroidota bacterium]
MAHPKRKMSKSRTAKRRSQYKISRIPNTHSCDNCGETKLMHRACPSCGYYRGRAVIARADNA